MCGEAIVLVGGGVHDGAGAEDGKFNPCVWMTFVNTSNYVDNIFDS
jgi:hypothetical protein